jgi:four helix bundle protein
VEKSRDLRVRAFDFAVDVVRFSRSTMQDDMVLRRIALQLVEAAGSIGANLEEAAAAQSRADFVAKNCIALKEAREARFWLRLLATTEPQVDAKAQALLEEARELVAMLTAAVKTARSGSRPRGM